MPTNGTEKPATDRDEEADAAAKESEPAAAPAETAPRPKRKKPKRPAASAPEAPQKEAKPTEEPDDGTATVVMIALLVLTGTGALAVIASRGSAGGGPRTAVAQESDIELTLVAADKKNLACAASTAVGGKHCEFETPEKRSTKGGDGDDVLLKPYTTTDGRSLLAAGVWTQPALASTLPAGRFTARCRFKPDGKVSKPAVRWVAAGKWNESSGSWDAGTVSGCVVGPAAQAR